MTRRAWRTFPRWSGQVPTCPQCGAVTPRVTAVDAKGRPRLGSYGTGVPPSGIRLSRRHWRRFRTARGANKAVCVHPFHETRR